MACYLNFYFKNVMIRNNAMTCFTTPAGIFRILLNGEPAEFELVQGQPVVFRTVSNGEIITANSYIASIPISGFSRYDLVSGVLDTCVLQYSGCTAGIESMMYHNDYCTFELSTLYTEDYEDDPPNRFLPYESYSHNPHGFAMRMIDDPQKYMTYPLQKEIGFLIAWAYTDEATWSTQADVGIAADLSSIPHCSVKT